MKRIPFGTAGLAATAAAFLVFSLSLRADSDSDTEVILQQPIPISATDDTPPSSTPPPVVGLLTTVAYPDGGVVNCQISDGQSPLVGLGAGGAVGIQIIFPAEFAGLIVTAQALDGGTASVTLPDGVIGEDGVATLGFVAGTAPGLYRMVATVSEAASTVRFWVPNPDNPSGDPPVLLPTYPN